jgi:hypothetical protein
MPLPSVRTVPREVCAVVMAVPPAPAPLGDAARVLADVLGDVLLVPLLQAAAVSATMTRGATRIGPRARAGIGVRARGADIGELPFLF